MDILVIGLGKLGYPMGEFLSSSYLHVNAYDKNEKLIDDLKNGINPFPQEKAIDIYRKNNNNLNFFYSLDEAIINTDICFITVPTPSLPDNSFDNSYILEVLDSISNYLLRNKGNLKNYIININSTVAPGSIDDVFIKFMESKGLKNNKHFSFIYNPYFVALGDVVKGLENPDMILLGNDNEDTVKFILDLYNKIYKSAKYTILSFREAELTKLLVNSYLTLKISYSNMVKDLLKNYPNTNSNQVLEAIGGDNRIGLKFLKPGGPFSGPCLPRDNLALNRFSQTQNYENFLSEAVEKTNVSTLNFLKEDIKEIVKKNYKSVIFAGIGYKSNTPSMEESFILELIDFANSLKLKVYYFDDYIDVPIKNAVKIDKDNLSKYGDLVFLSYVDIRFNFLIEQKNLKIVDIWHQLQSKNIYRTFSEI